MNDTDPFEGKIVVLGYKQVDRYHESNAVFVYCVVKGRLEALLDIWSLPIDTEADWDEEEQKDKALETILELNTKEVFTSWLDSGELFGVQLGYFPLSDEIEEDPNDGAHVCWCEYVGLDYDFIERLEQQQIEVQKINTETMQIV